MLAFGNKEFRNLQEQVLENMKQIDDIKQAAVVLDEFGIKVVGQIESADDLPDPEEYEGDFGDAYAVGTEAPYELYIWTRGDSLGNNAYWFNIGAFPEPGPQGPKGDTGDQGPSGTIAFGSMSVTTTEPGTNANVSFTNIGTASNAVYNLSWYIPRGAQGIPGETGATGATGATGPQGPKGDKGDTGTGYIIMGQLDSELDLPDPGATDRQAAYLVGAHEPYDLYVIVGLPGHLEWFDSGSFTTAEADISEFEAGYGLSLGEIDTKITYAVDNTVIPNFQDLSDLAWNINASVANTYATKASLSSFQSDVNSAFSSVYASISSLSSSIANVSGSLSEYAQLSGNNTFTGANTFSNISAKDISMSDYLRIYSDSSWVGTIHGNSSRSALDIAGYDNLILYASKSMYLSCGSNLTFTRYGDNYAVFDLPSSSGLFTLATEKYVNDSISALDYASVNALSADTVIPDITGLASESYVDDSIAALSSVYASISAIPDMSEYATVSQVSSAISALNYASVGALSSNTYIPPTVEGTYDSQYWATLTIDGTTRSIPSLTGYATETYVQNELSGYAKQSELSNYTPLSQISLYASVSAVESAISGVNSTISSLDYASVGALSAATVIPDTTGLASETYVNNSISALSSVYAPIGSYATESYVASAISAIDYASVGALSSGTVLPNMSLYAELSASNIFSGTNTFNNIKLGKNLSISGIVAPNEMAMFNEMYADVYGKLFLNITGAYPSMTVKYENQIFQLPNYSVSQSTTYTLATVNDIPRVSGSYSGSYWTEITLGDITKEIPQGGGSVSGAALLSANNVFVGNNSFDNDVYIGTGKTLHTDTDSVIEWEHIEVEGQEGTEPEYDPETGDEISPGTEGVNEVSAIVDTYLRCDQYMDMSDGHTEYVHVLEFDAQGTDSDVAIGLPAVNNELAIYSKFTYESEEPDPGDPDNPDATITISHIGTAYGYIGIGSDANDGTTLLYINHDSVIDLQAPYVGINGYEIATKAYVNTTVGNIDTILQNINGGSI